MSPCATCPATTASACGSTSRSDSRDGRGLSALVGGDGCSYCRVGKGSEALMRALVVYESMYGNTHLVADAIADGLRTNGEVTVVPVKELSAELVDRADLLVMGSPTHVHGMTRPK